MRMTTAPPPLTRRPPVLLDNVTVRYPHAEAPTLWDVNLQVAPGELLSVVGASGAGKTTLLRLLTGQLRPTTGTAVVAGLDLGDLKARHLPKLRRRIGVTFQDARLLPGRTGMQNIAYALELSGYSATRARTAALAALERVGVGDLADRVPEQMSGGQAQRVGIARALAGAPQVLFVDEPTGNLDPDTTLSIIDTLAAVADAGTAVVMATHDVAAVDHLGRRVVLIADGGIGADMSRSTYADTASLPIVAAAVTR